MEAVLELQVLEPVELKEAGYGPEWDHRSHASLLLGCHHSSISLLTCH
ncbi:SapB/AmfS family lanthipeptide [Amycolatopsis pittospori]|nr:SapB/AmfS family lanthipeptide [Amycolatopsis pittospori]